MPREIRVLVADAYPLSRAGIRALLAAEDDLTLVGEAADAREASRLSAELKPNVLLLDTNLTGLPAGDLVSLLHRRCPTVRVLALVGSNEEDSLRRLLAAGAAGCVLRSEATERVVAAVRAVGTGAPWYSPEVLAGVLARAQGKLASPRGASGLTDRQLEVVSLVGRGWSDARIGSELAISARTVRFHVHGVCSKLELRTRAEAIAWAVRSGLA